MYLHSSRKDDILKYKAIYKLNVSFIQIIIK